MKRVTIVSIISIKSVFLLNNKCINMFINNNPSRKVHVPM